MTVRILGYRGCGDYYLDDPGHELDGIRDGPAGRVLAGGAHGDLDAMVRSLLSSPLRSGRRALDVIVAAPKPVSLLLAIEPAAASRRVVAAHDEAVRAALGYLLGVEVERAVERGGPAVVAFTHGVNRLLDPHLHTHVLIGARDAHGSTVPTRDVRRHANAADAIYVAALRAALPEAAGRAAWVSASGATRVDGVDHGLVAATSTPRERDGRFAREAPKSHPSAADVRRHWAEVIGAAARMDPPARPQRTAEAIDEHRFAAELGDGMVGLPEVVRAWAMACTFGERPERVLAAAGIVASRIPSRGRVPAVVVRDAAAVRVLGPRPTDLEELGRWQTGRRELARLLEEGRRPAELVDPRGSSPAVWLAAARLDAAAPLRRRTSARLAPQLADAGAISLDCR